MAKTAGVQLQQKLAGEVRALGLLARVQCSPTETRAFQQATINMHKQSLYGLGCTPCHLGVEDPESTGGRAFSQTSPQKLGFSETDLCAAHSKVGLGKSLCRQQGYCEDAEPVTLLPNSIFLSVLTCLGISKEKLNICGVFLFQGWNPPTLKT